MAKKQKPFMVIETKEEFDKHFKDIFESGEAKGFREGITHGLSYVLETIEKFTKHEKDYFNEIQREAEYILGNRHKAEYKLYSEILEMAKKKAADDYLKEHPAPTAE